ncbi:hypothetical protein ACFQ1E_17960 [Sphingomonas canadensis]|uniref:DUF2059 domain-containing protein n=1 Tax=Sphingomonas canadensis TaxID=1219257 RepID=A0ABW3H9R2_9SPHN|nr:hypothetical protein [Sphingomonas canadensis]MCW3837973.1 hypothetical protein [Sphingomonas canadensis]
MRGFNRLRTAARWSALAACFALPVEATAQEARCLPLPAARALITGMLPSVLDELRERCADRLPADALLANMPKDVMGKYRSAADKAWPQVLDAFAAMEGKELGDAERAIAGPLIQAMIGPALLEKFDPADCAPANDLITALAPLPPENLATAAVTIFELGRKDRESEKLRPCPRNAK